MTKVYTINNTFCIEIDDNITYLPQNEVGLFSNNVRGTVGITQNNVVLLEEHYTEILDKDGVVYGDTAFRAMTKISLQTNKLTNDIGTDPAGRLRVGQLTTLFDGKELGSADDLLWEKVGTGSFTFSDNKTAMVVTAGQYAIKASYLYMNYNSGKSLQVEFTFRKFAKQTNIVKRAGYFSSNAVAPYASNYDGFWIESSDNIYLCISNNGTQVIKVPIEEWSGYELVKDYDFDKFSVAMFDYLWLGGANFRFFLMTEFGFILAHQYIHAGQGEDVFTKSPNHKVRYEIRSTGGAGQFDAICSQVSSEGSISESGKQRSVNTGATAITLTNIGTTYPILAIRKKVASRDRDVKQVALDAFTDSANDKMIVSLHLNPTFSVAPTFVDVPNSYAQKWQASGTASVTLTGANLEAMGTMLYSFIIAQNAVIPPNILEQDFLSRLSVSLDNTPLPLVIACTPISGGVTAWASINYKEV